MRWAGHTENMKEERSTCKISVEKPERNKPLERDLDAEEKDNIKMNLN
jgi:hypothetical protein